MHPSLPYIYRFYACESIRPVSTHPIVVFKRLDNPLHVTRDLEETSKLLCTYVLHMLLTLVVNGSRNYYEITTFFVQIRTFTDHATTNPI
jgi:hypothetical protein